MKVLFFCILTLFSASALALDEGQIVMDLPKSAVGKSAVFNLTEAGLHYSSINNGSMFAAVGILHEWDNGFALGVRGYLPMQFSKQSNAYIGEINARFILLNEINQAFIAANLAEGFFNTTTGTTSFSTGGVDFGYSRKINTQVTVGALLGVAYSGSRLSEDQINGGGTFYNKIGLTAGYYF